MSMHVLIIIPNYTFEPTLWRYETSKGLWAKYVNILLL